MREDFFLASDDWGEPWGPRSCWCAGTCRVRQTNQLLFCVKVIPPLPGELAGRSHDVSDLLLGSTNGTDTLSFIVDIYATKSIAKGDAIDSRDLIRIGTGTVHQSRMQAEMQYGEGYNEEPLAMGKTEQFEASTVRFLSEQDGVPERKLKGRLARLFSEHGGVVRGYLVQVDYGNPDEFNVVLCLRLTDEPKAELMSEINRVFADMFRSDEHLDVLILGEAQEVELLAVCRPFYGSTGN